MLIIFDLDDTLIDTSNTIIPIKLKYALEQMIFSGLSLDDPKRQLKKLLRINKRSESSKEALEKFLIIHKAKEKFLDIGINAVYNEFDPTIKIRPRKGANKILNILKKNHKLALVSKGHEEFQKQKLKNAGIDFSLFSTIMIVQNENKKNAYKKIIDDLKEKAENTIVCGDRISIDLLPAKELRCITVHMRYGRGKCCDMLNENLIDYEINELVELTTIIKSIGWYNAR